MTEGESKISEWVGEVHEGDAYEVLDDMPSNSVNMAMTSPPYYGLRDYNVDEQIGHEESLVEYIDNIVEIGNEVQRVLRDEGSWWLKDRKSVV